MGKDQKIECNVYSCKYLDCDKEICKLGKIKVTGKDAIKKEDTICSSYKER